MPLNRSLVEEEAPGTNIATGASKTDKDVTADVDVDNGDCIDDEDENSENDGGKEDDEDGEDGDCFAKFDDKSVKLEGIRVWTGESKTDKDEGGKAASIDGDV